MAAYSFSTGFKIHGGPGTLLVSLEMLLYAVALGCLVSAFVVRDGWTRRIQTVVALVLGIAIATSVAYEITVLNPNYGTDVIAFAHAGAEILLDGRNPYEATPGAVEQAADRFGVILTRTSSGGVIDWLISYPALHVLWYTTFLSIEVTDLRWATLVVELIAIAVIWRALSPRGRLFVPPILLVEPFLMVTFTAGGVTDWLWVLPLAVSAISLHRERFGWAGVALGLACAVKQHPWFAVPFVLVWVIRTVSRRSSESAIGSMTSMGGFSAGLVAGFVIPNLPFFIWSPSDWTRSVLSPALGSLVPDGHGLSLLASRELIPLSPIFYTVLMATVFVALVVIYARYFDRLHDLLWVLPPIVMFLSYRSLHSYFVFWLPIAVLWLDLRFVQRNDYVLVLRRERLTENSG